VVLLQVVPAPVGLQVVLPPVAVLLRRAAVHHQAGVQMGLRLPVSVDSVLGQGASYLSPSWTVPDRHPVLERRLVGW
jgi:hypothetical protein